MIGIAILLIVLIVITLFGFWDIDIKLDYISADLDRIENRINAIADAVGALDELEDTWPTMPDLYPVTGEPEP